MRKRPKTVREKTDELLRQEKGRVIKPRGGRTTVALVYPSSYYVGMSSLGYQAVYSIINSRDDALAERAFYPDHEDLGAFKAGARLTTLESRSYVADYEIVAFSVSFENDYANIPEILRFAGVPPKASDRDERSPLILMGGICASFNPEPVAEFFDAIIIGEAEDVLGEFLDVYRDDAFKLSRRELLIKLSGIPGVYIPSLYTPAYSPEGGYQSMTAAPGAPVPVLRRYTADLETQPAKSAITTTETEFSGMFLVELSRGCGRHCRFCMAGYVTRPPRPRGFDAVMADINEGIASTGKVGLVGAAVSDYPEIGRIAEYLEGVETSISASSLRADSMTPELVRLVSRGNRTVAIAPEAGSQRMRAVINKNLTEEQILDAVRTLIEGGVLNIKLYFMIGLPFEQDEDIDAIVELAKKAHNTQLELGREKGRLGQTILSVNCFIPKPWTPFQWDRMEDITSLNRKIKRIKDGLKGVHNMNVINDAPKAAYLQAALSRGDRRVSEAVVVASMNDGDWKKAFKEAGLSMEEFAGRLRDKDEAFPWDIIGTGIDRRFLWKERELASVGASTRPCDVGYCRLCGVCED